MILFDTTILIEILRKKPEVLKKLQEFSSESLFTTEINTLELLYGVFGSSHYIDQPDLLSQRAQEIEALLQNFRVLPFKRQAAYRTARILGQLKIQGNIIDFRDGMIAGISLANGISRIFTQNVKDFGRIDDLELVTLG